MRKVYRIEFGLSGDLVELYEIALRTKKSEVSLEEMNRSLFISGVLQHLSALLAHQKIAEPDSTRARDIMAHLWGKALGIDSSPLPAKQSPSEKRARDMILKRIERLKRIIQNTDLPVEIVFNEVQIFKRNLDKFLYALGT